MTYRDSIVTLANQIVGIGSQADTDLTAALAKNIDLQKQIDALKAPPVSAAVIYPGDGKVAVDAKGVKFTISATGQISENGVIDIYTNGVVKLEIMSGQARQTIADGRQWYYTGPGTGYQGWTIGAPAVVMPVNKLPALLSKGFNIEYAGPYIGETAVNSPWDDIKDAELDAYKASGVTHFRTFMSDAWGGWYSKGAPVNPANNPAWVSCLNWVKKLQSKGFLVIFTWIFGGNVEDDPANSADLAAKWSEIATWLRANGVDPNLFVCDTSNEPTINVAPTASWGAEDQLAWMAIERQIIDSIQHAWPEVWVAMTATAWDSIDLIVSQKPHMGSDGKALPKLLAQVHCYNSMGFTHQQTSWMNPQSYFNTGPKSYPGFEGWNRAMIDAEHTKFANWLSQWGIGGFLGEFGCTESAPAADRMAWVKDRRESAEKMGLGWTWWSLNKSIFAAVSGPVGSRMIRSDFKSALGLA